MRYRRFGSVYVPEHVASHRGRGAYIPDHNRGLWHPEVPLSPAVRAYRSIASRLHVPAGIMAFDWMFSSESGVRPAANYGITVTPTQNTDAGTFVELFSAADVARDVYFIRINVNSTGTTAVSDRTQTITVGIDPAGSTTYTNWLAIQYLLCGGAAPLVLNNAGNGGMWFEFPLFVKSGSSVAVRARQDNATPTTIRVWAQIFGQPQRPDLVRAGQKVTAYGTVIDANNSGGTSVTPGTTNDGTYVSLGTPTVENWWWQLGSACADTTMSTSGYFMDLAYGDGSNKYLILEDVPCFHGSDEARAQPPIPFVMASRRVKANVEIFGRMQCNTTADATMMMAAYGLSG